MKVTIDGMTFEGSEEEIERVVKKHGTHTTHTTNAYAGPAPQPRGSDWLSRVNPGDSR